MDSDDSGVYLRYPTAIKIIIGRPYLQNELYCRGWTKPLLWLSLRPFIRYVHTYLSPALV